MKPKILIAGFLGLFWALALTKDVFAIPAIYQRCDPGETTCIIGEFVFEDDGNTPKTTNGFCEITIKKPDNTSLVADEPMSDKDDGWYYYDVFSLSPKPTTEGLYRSIICCDTGANKRCIDKTFILGTSFEGLPAKIWNYTTRTLTDFGTLVADIAAAVWGASTRTLNSFGTLVADVWTYATRGLTEEVDLTSTSTKAIWDVAKAELTTAGSIGKAFADNRAIKFNANGEIAAGSGTNNYKAKLFIYDLASQLVNAVSNPTITLYDSTGAVATGPTSMTLDSTGIYSYQYTIGSSVNAGRWEAVVTIDTSGANIIKTSGYFEVESSPARVTINSITDKTVPDITANFTIANEGTVGYEYHYKYCVVDTIENVCDGVNEIAWGQSAEWIDPGEEFTTPKTLTVNNTGTYIYKVVVYWGTEKSVAALQFDAISGVTPPSGGLAPTPVAVCSGADFNHNGIVDSVDFSILLYFWKTQPPFRNSCVDINKDGQVNSIDFSILLYQWGKPGVNIK